jgi:hypothetical protein
MRARRILPATLLVAGVLALDAVRVQAAAQTTHTPATITGTFYIIWRDGAPDERVGDDRRYAIIDDQGAWYEVQPDAGAWTAFGGARALDRRRVTLDARAVIPARDAGTGMPVIRASAARLAEPSLRASVSADYTTTYPAVTGSQPYVTILCRFQDTPESALPPKSTAEAIMGSSYPGMDNYYREVSGGQINLAGSKVVGWYTLPQPRAYYMPNGTPDLGKLAEDCTGAADNDVYFPDYRGINLQFSDRFDCCSYGGGWLLKRDGQNRGYGMTWLANWALTSANYGHEMGHSFGFPHSHGPYGQVYDSKWDVMSDAYVYRNSTWGWIGQHTIAYHKNLVGWIPAARRFVAPAGKSSTITIERSAQPEANGNYLMAIIPIPNSTQFYTVEARRFVGNYDAHVPGEAIVLHRCGDDATVIDADNNGNPNDAGAMWLPGETFTDAAHNISVSVEAQVGNAWRVTIRNQVTSAPPSLSIAVSAAESDSAMIHTATPVPDSAAVTLSGPGAASATWSASKKASWLTLTTASGTGSGMVRWTRQTQSLAPGTYVDTITVTTSGASGSPARLVDTFVVLPEPGIDAAAASLLGTTALATAQQRWLDAHGNNDGVYNLGDFLALVHQSSQPVNSDLIERVIAHVTAPPPARGKEQNR